MYPNKVPCAFCGESMLATWLY